jgi:hypothetical protein
MFLIVNTPQSYILVYCGHDPTKVSYSPFLIVLAIAINYENKP